MLLSILVVEVEIISESDFIFDEWEHYAQSTACGASSMESSASNWKMTGSSRPSPHGYHDVSSEEKGGFTSKWLTAFRSGFRMRPGSPGIS